MENIAVNNEKQKKEPLFHIVKKDNNSWKRPVIVRALAIIISIIVATIIVAIAAKTNPFKILGSMFEGAFGTKHRFWVFIRESSLLLIVAIGLVPAFKMKFWNLGGNGQILIGCLVTITCMMYLGGKVPDGLLVLIMFVSGMAAGAIWALIPGIFKAFFNTNESLFTLMLNYIATGLVTYAITKWVKTGSGSFSEIELTHGIKPLFGEEAVWPLIISLVLSGIMFAYFKFSKHGYEVSVVGESERTAQYIGINVKKVVIRTLILSGAICGLAGVLQSGAITYTISEGSANNMGFTAIIAAWLAKFNPLIIIGTSLFINFINCGMIEVRMAYGFTNNSLSSIVTALIYFFIIGCEFFIDYKIVFRKKKDKLNKSALSSGEAK